MTDGARPHRRLAPRPYFFELFTIASFLAIHIALVHYAHVGNAVTSLWWLIPTLVQAVLVQLIVGVGVRCLVARVRGELRDYLRAIRTKQWAFDTARMVLFGTLSIHTYSWIKVMVPVLHPRLFDAELWSLDQALFFGASPTVFFLNVFSQRWLMRFIDVTYAYVFLITMNAVAAFFLSSPVRRMRIAFLDGNTLLWLAGAWLYLLVPSVGPAYRFPSVWLEYAPLLARTHELQTMLIHNYDRVLRPLSSDGHAVNVLFGVAAFPSLHVGQMAFAWLWSRRVFRGGALVLGLGTFFVFIGSVVTGWHYLIDSIAGFLLAWLCFHAAARFHRVRRSVHLREIVGRR